jgi:hypothetical protein
LPFSLLPWILHYIFFFDDISLMILTAISLRHYFITSFQLSHSSATLAMIIITPDIFIDNIRYAFFQPAYAGFSLARYFGII